MPLSSHLQDLALRLSFMAVSPCYGLIHFYITNDLESYYTQCGPGIHKNSPEWWLGKFLSWINRAVAPAFVLVGCSPPYPLQLFCMSLQQ